MKTPITLFLFLVFSFISSFAQPSYPMDEYIEMSDNKPIDSEAWNALSPGIYFTWGSIDVRYSHTNRPMIAQQDEMEIYVWRGERASAQAVIYTTQAYADLRVRLTKWQGADAEIAASNGEARFVNYVMTDQLNSGGGGCGYRPNPEAFDKSIVADCIDRDVAKSFVARTTRPVWCTLEVPRDATPGDYTATLELTQNGTVLKSLTLKIHILDRTLPLPADNSFHLDLWQQPFAVARYYQVAKWSKEHFDIMRPMMQRLARAGQRVITTTLVYEPWGDQSHDKWDPMIETVKKRDGSWAYDYTVFDRWVTFMMECGVDKQINCFSMVPWQISFRYFDEASSSYKNLTTTTSSTAYSEFWTSFLKAFATHLREKGWFDITTISVDERGLNQMLDALRVLRAAVPDMKMSLQGVYHAELVNELYDYCLAYGGRFSDAELAARNAKGYISTVYTCCTESRPNTFTFSPPAESTWLCIHAAQGNYAGYLRWAYANWGNNPLPDSRYRIWAAGDTYLVYPGNRSSIRFERIIEGVQNFEKIRILRQQYAAAGDTEKLDRLNNEVAKFGAGAITPSNAGTMVRSIERLLNDEPLPPVEEPDAYCEAPISSSQFAATVANRWFTQCSTTGADVNLNYTSSSPSEAGYVLSSQAIEVKAASSFSLNFVAKTNSDDLRYTKLGIFADWNGDKLFSESGQEAVHSYGISSQANPALLNYTTTINVPASARIGTTRLRLRFVDAWGGNVTPCGEMLKGFTFDLPVKISDPVGITYTDAEALVSYSSANSLLSFSTTIDLSLYSVASATTIARLQGITHYDTSTLPTGAYICDIRQGKKHHTYRFLK